MSLFKRKFKSDRGEKILFKFYAKENIYLFIFVLFLFHVWMIYCVLEEKLIFSEKKIVVWENKKNEKNLLRVNIFLIKTIFVLLYCGLALDFYA